MKIKLLLAGLLAWLCATVPSPALAVEIEKVSFARAQKTGPDAVAPAELVGHLMEYHEEPARDSMEKHRRFLEQHLGQGRR